MLDLYFVNDPGTPPHYMGATCLAAAIQAAMSRRHFKLRLAFFVEEDEKESAAEALTSAREVWRAVSECTDYYNSGLGQVSLKLDMHVA